MVSASISTTDTTGLFDISIIQNSKIKSIMALILLACEVNSINFFLSIKQHHQHQPHPQYQGYHYQQQQAQMAAAYYAAQQHQQLPQQGGAAPTGPYHMGGIPQQQLPHPYQFAGGAMYPMHGYSTGCSPAAAAMQKQGFRIFDNHY
jgi:hypothetical protein